MRLLLILAIASSCAKGANEDSAASPRIAAITSVEYSCIESTHAAELHITTETRREWESVTAAISSPPAGVWNLYIDMLPDDHPNIYSATMSIKALKCDMPIKTEYWLFDGAKYHTFR